MSPIEISSTIVVVCCFLLVLIVSKKTKYKNGPVHHGPKHIDLLAQDALRRTATPHHYSSFSVVKEGLKKPDAFLLIGKLKARGCHPELHVKSVPHSDDPSRRLELFMITVPDQELDMASQIAQ